MSKRKYNVWSQHDMDEASDSYRNKKLKFNEVCRTYKIPKPTFRRHLKDLNKYKRNGRPSDLTPEMELELVKHILELESCFFGLTIKDLRHLAFQLAEKYYLYHLFNKRTELAGWKWYYKFMKRHPEISLRAPEPTSMARCRGFNKKNVMEFFESLIDKEKFTASQIYIVDETGLSTVHKPGRVLAQKGKHQVGAVTSGERGTNTTAVCCMNAVGEFIPSMLIFKRKRMTDDLKREGPPNTKYTCSESGWIVSPLFFKWLEHFIQCTKLEKSQKKQILLILDGHSTHTKNIDAIRLARDYGIVMLSLPAHTSHKLQPLDKSFFNSLKQNFNMVCANWMRSNPGKVIKQSNISEILGKAYPRAVCMDTAMNGFESCGLWPCNRYKIRDEDFVTVDEIDELISDIQASNDTQDKHVKEIGRSPMKEILNTQVMPGPSTSNGANSLLKIKAVIETISPKSRISVPQSRLAKGTTASQILTDSPYKNNLEEKLAVAELKSTVTKKINLDLDKTKTVKGKRETILSKKIKLESKKRSTPKNMKMKQEDDDWFCKICHETRKENMIQCSSCGFWTHELCSSADRDTVTDVCDVCKD